MNGAKTKLMTNSTEEKVHIIGIIIEYVEDYFYLRKTVSFFNRQIQKSRGEQEML